MSRIGLGCMRLSTDEDRDETRAVATIAAALAAGTSWLDTARAYAPTPTELGHNERLIARVAPNAKVRITTKCGMARPDGRWQPDGRATSILAAARASTEDLGRTPDLLLLHAPDPRVPLATSVRALVRAKREGLAHAIGLSNVTRKDLDALGDVPIDAVQVALGAYDDDAARGGVIAWCKERGILVQAHSPLGGPKRAPRLARDPVLRTIAARHANATPAMIVLAYLLALADNIVPIVGARRPESAASAVAAERIILDTTDLDALDARFPGLAWARRPPLAPSRDSATADVIVLMGIAGAGKSKLAASYVERGYERLNRDTLGGTLDGIAQRLAERLAAGVRRVVLDNTYITRASRSEVLRIAHRAGAAVTCVHLETPTHDAQSNLVVRMLERHGRLLGGTELSAIAKTEAGLFGPNVLFRMERQLEPPTADEGFASIEVVPFVREHEGTAAGIAIPIELLLDRQGELRPDAARLLAPLPPSAPLLLFGHEPAIDASWQSRALERAASLSDRVVELGVCTHGDGPPVCWCRPPLPGLWLAFALRHAIDPRASVIVTASSAHRTMAKRLGLRSIVPAELLSPRRS